MTMQIGPGTEITLGHYQVDTSAELWLWRPQGGACLVRHRKEAGVVVGTCLSGEWLPWALSRMGFGGG